MRSFATAYSLAEHDGFDVVDEAVREMFDALLARPVPDRLLALVDRLEASAEPELA